ncbi:MAG TPA: glycosyltransferase family 39 protein [Solirubrobacteraceae bacterium]|nr:glycosyltransferase family 39 protein [Solirubrobacteraceae bacterium]
MSTTEYRAPVPVRTARRRLPPVRLDVKRIPPHVWGLAGLTLLAAGLRFATIASQSYWADEALTVHEVQMPFASMLSAVTHAETTPPLYFILAWAWAHLFGTGEAALRSLSALLGVIVIPLTYLCGRELVSRRAGLIAAAFAAVNPFLIWYSQEARAYMLVIVLTGASFLWFIRAERKPSRGNVVWWTIFSALALATHFFSGFLVAPEAVWLLWRARSRLVLAACAVLAAVQLALAPLAVQDTGHGLGWIHAIPRLTRISQVPTEFAVMTIYRHVSISEGLWGGAIAIAVAVVLLALVGGRQERRGALIAAVIAVTAIAAPLLLGLIRAADDVFLVRNVSPAWIPIAVALAAACAAPRARDLGTVVATMLVVMFAIAAIEIASNPVFQRADWRGVARAIGPSSEPRAILITGGAEADALKVFVHGVAWNQPPITQRVTVDEIVVVGSVAHVRLRGPDHRKGRALPVRVARGAVSLGGKWVRNFYVARYELVRPWHFDAAQLSARAGRFFRHRAPKQLLVLVAGGVPRAGSVRIITPRLGRAQHARNRHRARARSRRGRAHHRQRPGRPARSAAPVSPGPAPIP